MADAASGAGGGAGVDGGLDGLGVVSDAVACGAEFSDGEREDGGSGELDLWRPVVG